MNNKGAEAAPALGFGCSSLGSELGYRDSCRLIEAAFDAGFRHFDLAPVYGNGSAERVVGDVLHPVRAQLTLVSKAGLPHPRHGVAKTVLRRLALPLKRRWPVLWQRASGRSAAPAAARGRFAAPEIAASVAESLKRLRTDHLDALLLHELLPTDLSPDLVALLQELRSTGRAQALGTGTGVEASEAVLQRHAAWLSWVQVPHYWGGFRSELRRPGLRLLTHRCLRTGAELVQSAMFQSLLRAEPDDELQRVLADPAALHDLLLNAALARLPAHGVVLVSTLKRERLRGMLAQVHAGRLPLALRLDACLARCMASSVNLGHLDV